MLGREMAGGLHLMVLVAWSDVLCLSGGVVLVGVWCRSDVGLVGYIGDVVVWWWYGGGVAGVGS